MWKQGGLVMLFAWLMPAGGGGQTLVLQDTLVLATIKSPVDPVVPLVKYRFSQDIEYSFTFSNVLFLNWQRGNGNNQVALLQHLKYHSLIDNTRSISINTSFDHTLGMQFFFDSISRFQPDDNTLDNRLEITLHKNLKILIQSNLTTRLFNAYNYSTGQTGNLTRTISSSFFTPLLWTFSAGFGWVVPRLGMFSMGLSAAKLTLIRNRAVYEESGVSEFYGVPRDKGLLFEYGLSLHLVVDKNFLNRIQWNCDVLVFKNYKKPIDLVMRNLVGIRINKFVKASIQTRLFYEEETSKNIQVENLISVGFYFLL
jgi:hypothetical protein